MPGAPTATRSSDWSCLALTAGRRRGLPASLDAHQRRARFHPRQLSRRRSSAAAMRRSTACCAASPAASSRRALPARRRAGGWMCCRPGATSIPSIPARSRRRAPGRWAGSRRRCILERHRQEHGNWPRALVLSAWGTANMRTGGDDIAQALALIGVRPTWDVGASGRVAGFEILPLSLLDRPRVDVTLRVSGFFRDAFPAQIDLFDSAVRAVAELDEPEHLNPIAARVRHRTRRRSIAQGVDRRGRAAQGRLPRVRLASRAPMAPGLQALIDERGWSDEGDFARAYLGLGRLRLRRRRGGRGGAGRFSHRLDATSTRSCTTRTTASTICWTATTTTSSRAGWPPPSST